MDRAEVDVMARYVRPPTLLAKTLASTVAITLSVAVGMTCALVASDSIIRQMHRCEYPFGAHETVPRACSDRPQYEDPELNELPPVEDPAALGEAL